MRVPIKQIVGDSALTLEDGQKVYPLIKRRLDQKQGIELDFEGITLFASLFFNAALGQLLRDFKPDFLNTLVKIDNLNDVGLATMKRSIENAKQFYASADFQRTQTEVLRAMAEAESCP
jgi:STAS-like domain of unknown function (DUF4325)